MSEHTAARIRDLGGPGYKRLYRMSPPLDGHRYVVASAVDGPFSGPETYLFPADDTGEITDWLELSGSQKGLVDCDEAIRSAGYRVID